MPSSTSALAEKPTRLGDVIRFHAAHHPERGAMKFEGRETSYADMDAQTNQVANGLIAAGVKRGERVGFIGKNSDLFFEILFGTAKMGGVCLPIGWRLASAEVAHILKDGAVSLLFVGEGFRDVADAAIRETSLDIPVIEVGDAFVSWRESQSRDDLDISISPSDTTLQLYTSGTTGRPKGVMLSHTNLLKTWSAAGDAGFDWFQWSDDVCLVAMPVSHVGGTSWAIVNFLFGGTALVVKEFDPIEIMGLIEPERITKMFLVPAALNFLIQMPGATDIDYSRLKVIFYGASPIPLDLLRKCMEVFGCDFCQQYGMTEASGTIVYLPPSDHDPEGNRRMRSAGLPMPGVEIRILDSEGNELPTAEVGEVAIRSSSNMLGYWNNEEATRSTIAGDGWLRSGDAGYLDADGYLYIHDRVKDMIISGAENIYPAEVESAIFGHPDVAEVAVIGVPDEKWGEAVKAVVALKPGCEPNEADILNFARTRIAGFKVPKSVDFVSTLPRNPTGKVLKRELRAPYWEGRDRQVN